MGPAREGTREPAYEADGLGLSSIIPLSLALGLDSVIALADGLGLSSSMADGDVEGDWVAAGCVHAPSTSPSASAPAATNGILGYRCTR